MVMVDGVSGHLIYDVTDPLRPKIVCRIQNTSPHIVSGTAFVYLVPRPNGTTDMVLHELGSNHESVAGTFHADLTGSYLDSPWASVSWTPIPFVLGFSTNDGTDSNGFGVIDVWIADANNATKVYSYSVPGVDSFGRPGLPPPTLAVSSDGGYIAAGWAINNSIHVFRFDNHADVSPAMPAGFRFAFWSRFGHTLYIVGSSGVEVWKPESGAAGVPGTGPWTLQPNFSPDGAQLAFTALTANRDIRSYVYDFNAKASRVLIDQSRSSVMFVKSGWVWYLEEKPCVPTYDNTNCFDPTQPDGNVLAMNLATNQESPVTFAAGEAPIQSNEVFMWTEDVWPLN